MRRPHDGQVPSGGIEFGFQNLEHSSHQGTRSQSLLRTRILIGVAPISNASLNERSR